MSSDNDGRKRTTKCKSVVVVLPLDKDKREGKHNPNTAGAAVWTKQPIHKPRCVALWLRQRQLRSGPKKVQIWRLKSMYFIFADQKWSCWRCQIRKLKRWSLPSLCAHNLIKANPLKIISTKKCQIKHISLAFDKKSGTVSLSRSSTYLNLTF